MIGSGIDLDRHGRAGPLRGFGQSPARLRRRPVVLLSDQDQQRAGRAVAAVGAGGPAPQPRRASRIEGHGGPEARRRARRDHRGERRRPTVRSAHEPDAGSVDEGQRAEVSQRRVGVTRPARRADVVAARRRVGAQAGGKTARREAVRHEHDVAASDELRRPAAGRAARARAEAAAVVHDHDGGKRP